MPSAAKRWTVDDLASLPDDGNRYEIIDGELLATPVFVRAGVHRADYAEDPGV